MSPQHQIALVDRGLGTRVVDVMRNRDFVGGGLGGSDLLNRSLGRWRRNHSLGRWRRDGRRDCSNARHRCARWAGRRHDRCSTKVGGLGCSGGGALTGA